MHRSISKKLFITHILLIISLFLFAQNNKPASNFIPYYKNGKWGYCNTNKQIIVPCIFDSIYPFDCYTDQQSKLKSAEYGYAFLKGKQYMVTDKKKIFDDYDPDVEYVINKNLKLVILPNQRNANKYDFDPPPPKKEILQISPYSNERRPGLGYAKFNDIKYDILEIGGTKVKVIKDNKLGLAILYPGTLDVKSWIFPVEYDKIESVYSGEIYLTKKNGLCQVYKKGQKFIGPFDDIKYKIMNPFLQPGQNDLLFFVKQGDAYFFIDEDGKELPWGKFDAMVPDNYSKMFIGLQKKEKWGIINKYGKIIIPFIYDKIDLMTMACNMIEVTKGDKLGYIDLAGKEYF